MVGFIIEIIGGNYMLILEGQYIMVCSWIVDLGIQSGFGLYLIFKWKICIFWELFDECMIWKDQDGNEYEGLVLYFE